MPFLSDFALLTVLVLIGGPVLIWAAACVGDRNHDEGYGSGCCVLWLVLLFGWIAQAIYELDRVLGGVIGEAT